MKLDSDASHSSSTKEPGSSVLGFEDVAVGVAGRELLSAINFELAPGEIVGLIGRNGVGKTTLLRAAAAQQRPSRGKIRLGDREVSEIPRRAMARRVAVVAQDLHVPFPFRVGELVLMGRAPHQPWLGLDSDHDVELALSALARLGIADLADRDITTLSGGERQLALVARALVGEPEILLLDEPTAFLDLKHRLEVLREVRAFVEAGRSALIVSHDLSLAARSCDRIVLLGEGCVVAVGPPREVLTQSNLRAAFGIESFQLEAPDGSVVVVPELSTSE